MALHAGLSRPYGAAVTRRRVALGALCIIDRCLVLHRIVRRVAREARETSVTLTETRAGGQHQRLVARVPGAAQIRCVHRRSGHAVATAAQFVDLVCSRPAWIFYRRVLSSRPVARFTTDSHLRGVYRLIHSQGQDAGGVATEATQDGGWWIEDTITLAGLRPMTGCQGIAVGGAIPAFTVLQIVVAVCPTDESDGLRSCAECPFAWLIRFGSRESPGVSSGGLCGELRGVAGLAGRRPGVAKLRSGGLQ